MSAIAPAAPIRLGARSSSFLEFVAPLTSLAPFVTSGTFRGVPGPGPRGIYSTGHLPSEYRAAVTAETVDYVVYSYSTPIAWHDSVSGWSVPDVSYSVTTSRHQGKIRAALSVA